MNSKLGIMFIAIIAGIILFLLGGFVVNNKFGMAFVILAIGMVGWAAGNVMDTRCTTSEDK